MPAIVTHQIGLGPSAAHEGLSREGVATPWSDQVKRLQTPGLAASRLSASRGRVRDTKGVRMSQSQLMAY